MTTFVFEVKNIPAALYKAMGGFATNGVNMTKLESYQKGASFSATMFYADIVGAPGDPAVDRALEELAFHCKELRMLGSYPPGRWSAADSASSPPKIATSRGRLLSHRARYMPGVLKAKAVVPSAASDDHPAIAAQVADLGQRRFRRPDCTFSPSSRIAVADRVRRRSRGGRYSPAPVHETAHGAVVGLGPRADHRRIADPAPALAGQPAGRGRCGDMALAVARHRAHGAVFHVGIEPAGLALAEFLSHWRRRRSLSNQLSGRPTRCRGAGRIPPPRPRRGTRAGLPP